MQRVNYRRIWESHFGPIPVDDSGRPYEIHHVDGNRNNNDISNLVCVSIDEHYKIHNEQGDHQACLIMSRRMELDYEDVCSIAKQAAAKRDQTGSKNPNYGKSTSQYVKQVWDSRSEEYKRQIIQKTVATRKLNGSNIGEKNPMYGRSAVTENKLRWYNNGSKSIYVPEGTQPEGYVPGRGKMKW